LAIFGAAIVGVPATSHAQSASVECTGGLCGTPNESGGGGGGCGCGCGCSILINQTDLGDTYQYSDDFDNDGWEDDFDNCPFSPNGDQSDADGDGFGDSCDNCRSTANPTQANANGNLLGDACDPDADGDGIPNERDNCLLFPNPDQHKSNPNATLGDVCNSDIDGDGIPNVTDNCVLVANPTQAQGDPARYGAACGGNLDTDGDNVPDLFDNCPTTFNTDQEMTLAAAGMGDACNADVDADGIPNTQDNCRTTHNPTQVDGDRDLAGDACDAKFCFTIDSAAPGRCLDPEAPFFARPGPNLTIHTGDRVRLRLFSNRAQTAIRYTWAMEHTPNGNRGWAILNPRGAVTNSSPWEYRYTADRTPSFQANEPGEYTLRLETELVFGDAKGFPKNNDVQTLKVTVEGNPTLRLAGCNQAGMAFPLLTSLGLLGLLFRRRR
jgi:hypothetical protein